MDFRCVALLALWTLLSGSVFSTPSGADPVPQQGALAATLAR